MMTRLDIARRRLAGQHLIEPSFQKAEDVVEWLGAVQAQDYPAAKWSVAQRTRGITDADVEQALTDGAIIRTHVLRPTWHFVPAADVRWMLALTAARVKASMAYYDRKLGLDDAVFRRSRAALTRALRGGRQLTRAELARVLRDARIDTKNSQRLGHLLMHAELDGVVCSGPRRGKQSTHALLEERVPEAAALRRDEALFELATRYFRARGPATVNDFAWWSGLSIADAKRGLLAAAGGLESEIVDGKTHWFVDAGPPHLNAPKTARLLPNYDEYFIGFRDRSAILENVKRSSWASQPSVLSAHVIAVDGQLVGGWKRTLKRNAVVVELNPVTRWGPAEQRAIAVEARRYGAFLGLPVELPERGST